MKKIIMLFFLIILLYSCTKNEEVLSPIKIQEEQITPTAFTMLTDPNSQMNNLLVGQKIEYNIKINNFDTNPEVVYVLKPVSGNIAKHQLKGTDFLFQTLEPNDVYMNRDSIIIKNTNSKLYLQILKPGTFQHEYTLQKMLRNKKVFAPATQPVLFSAVKINITTPPSWVAPNNFLRLYYFNIDDGDQLYDNYLTNSSSKSHVFFTSYEGIGRSENFTANVDFVFKEQTHSFTDFPNVNSHTIDEIKITQNISGGNVNVIRYNNLNF